MREVISIGIIGDFDPNRRSHQATNEALHHAAGHLSTKVDVSWVTTESLVALGREKRLEQFAGLWAAPGTPYLSQEGAHMGIRFAREQNWPFFGT